MFAAASSTRRHWIAAEHEDEHLAGTFRFVPVCTGDGSLSLGQAGGGPRFDASAAELQHRAEADRAQAVGAWARVAPMAFQRLLRHGADRVGASQENGARVQFHSNGYADGEWGNESHMWHLEDARFGTEDGGLFDLEGAADGSTVAWALRLAFPTPGRSGPEAHRPMRRAFAANTCGLPMTVREKPSPRFPRSRAAHACRSAAGACGLMQQPAANVVEAGVPGLCVL